MSSWRDSSFLAADYNVYQFSFFKESMVQAMNNVTIPADSNMWKSQDMKEDVLTANSTVRVTFSLRYISNICVRRMTRSLIAAFVDCSALWYLIFSFLQIRETKG